MSRPTVDYRMNSSYPPMGGQRRRKRGGGGCDCDNTYAKSLQGICKVLSLLIGLLAFIMVASTPYHRGIFIIGGQTWPFHIVMLLTVCVWLSTAFIYGWFLSQQHLNHPNVAWPTIELRFNIAITLIVLFDAILESANVWRWDMGLGFRPSNGYFGNANGGAGYGGLGSYGYSFGMPLSQSLGMSSYCSQYPTDCTEYFAMLSGNRSYYGNHIFASILLFLLFLSYLVASVFSFRTWRVFKQEMMKGHPNSAKLPKPSKWERFRYRLSEVKFPTVTATNVRERFAGLIRRSTDDSHDGHVVDLEAVDDMSKKDTIPIDEISEKPSYPPSSIYSSAHKSHRSHPSSSRHGASSDKRSRSSSGSRKPRRSHDDERSEKSYPESSRSPRSGSTSRSSHKSHHDRDGRRSHRSSGKKRSEKERSENHEKEDLIIDMKNIGKQDPEGDATDDGQLSPVASVMC